VNGSQKARRAQQTKLFRRFSQFGWKKLLFTADQKRGTIVICGQSKPVCSHIKTQSLLRHTQQQSRTMLVTSRDIAHCSNAMSGQDLLRTLSTNLLEIILLNSSHQMKVPKVRKKNYATLFNMVVVSND
jgi:hypothetical protein